MLNIRNSFQHLEKTDITDIDLLLFTSVLEPDLLLGVTFATIKDENGKILGETEEVNTRQDQYGTDLDKKNPNIFAPQHIFVKYNKEELRPLYSEAANAINELKASNCPGF